MSSSTNARDELFDDIPSEGFAERRKSKWGSKDALFVGKREVAHFEGRSGIDIRVTRAWIRSNRALGTETGISLRGQSDWLTVDVDECGADRAKSLLLTATEQNGDAALI